MGAPDIQGRMTGPLHSRDVTTASGWLRVLSGLLMWLEPIAFAIVAAGAWNAVSVRGMPVVLVLLARTVAAALCFAAGRALVDRRPSGPALAKVALGLSGAVHVFVYLTPYFPSNRVPGDTPLYVAATIAYYGGWLLYVFRSRQVAAIDR